MSLDEIAKIIIDEVSKKVFGCVTIDETGYDPFSLTITICYDLTFKMTLPKYKLRSLPSHVIVNAILNEYKAYIISNYFNE